MGRINKIPRATWENIKNEYVTRQASMRALSRKYEISVSTISERAKTEDWDSVRKQLDSELAAATTRVQLDKPQSNAEKAERTIENLLDKMVITSAMIQPGDTKSMKELTQCMKDLRELQVYTLKDIDEDAVRVTLLPELEEYSE